LYFLLKWVAPAWRTNTHIDYNIIDIKTNDIKKMLRIVKKRAKRNSVPFLKSFLPRPFYFVRINIKEVNGCE
jgi:hypothetical protein